MNDVDIIHPEKSIKIIKKYMIILLIIVCILTLISLIVFLFVILGMVGNFYTITDNTLINITASFNTISKNIKLIQFDINNVLLFLSNDIKNTTGVTIDYIAQIAKDISKITRIIGVRNA